MEQHKIDLYIDKLELEYRNLMSSYYRIMSYSKTLKGVEDLSDEDKEIINITMAKLANWSEQIYRKFHTGNQE